MKRIYADYAATSPMISPAIREMGKYIFDDWGNPSSAHAKGRRAREAIETARKRIAKAINAEPNEIFFTSGGTEANNWAMRFIETFPKTKRKIAISCIEHDSVKEAAKYEEERGHPVSYVQCDENGSVSPYTLRNSIDSQYGLVSIMFANNEIGTIEPIRDLAKTAHIYGALFHTDAVQAVGHVKIDVKKLDVDLLSMSAHKFGGPKGVGVLYIKDGIPIPKFICGGGQELGYRSGTENVAGIAGMGKALEVMSKQISTSKEFARRKAELLRKGLSEIDNVTFNSNDGKKLDGIISVTFHNVDARATVLHLDAMGVYISAGSACHAGRTEPSETLMSIGLTENEALSTVRFSIGPFISNMDIRRIVKRTKSVIARLRASQ